jgi:hypothetical protein
MVKPKSTLWHQRTDPENDSPLGSVPLKTPPLAQAPRPENFLARSPTRTRSKSKREKDMARLDFRLERERLFKEAFHDNIDSKGEVDH